jgi:hypothetical protein
LGELEEWDDSNADWFVGGFMMPFSNQFGHVADELTFT